MLQTHSRYCTHSPSLFFLFASVSPSEDVYKRQGGSTKAIWSWHIWATRFGFEDFEKDIRILNHEEKAFEVMPVSYTHLDVYKRQHRGQLYHFADNIIQTDYEPEDWAGLRRFVEQSAFRGAHVGANLIQAQRDWFGAHTFLRTDREGSFHHEWGKGL